MASSMLCCSLLGASFFFSPQRRCAISSKHHCQSSRSVMTLELGMMVTSAFGGLTYFVLPSLSVTCLVEREAKGTLLSLRNFSTSSFLLSQRRMQTETLFFFKVVRASLALPYKREVAFIILCNDAGFVNID